MINVPSEDHNDAAMIGSSSGSNNFTDARTKHLLNNIKVARTTRGCHKELNPLRYSRPRTLHGRFRSSCLKSSSRDLRDGHCSRMQHASKGHETRRMREGGGGRLTRRHTLLRPLSRVPKECEKGYRSRRTTQTKVKLSVHSKIVVSRWR